MTPIGKTQEFAALQAILLEIKELYPTPEIGDPSVTGEDACERDLRSLAEDARRAVKSAGSADEQAHAFAIQRWFKWAADSRCVSTGSWAQARPPILPLISDGAGGYLTAPDPRIRATIDKIALMHGWRVRWGRALQALQEKILEV